jgi:hypothetical protein
MDGDIGLIKVNTGVGTGGVGFLVVPSEIDRIQYIEDCYRTQTVTINGGEGYGFFSSVRCPQNILENLVFPTETSRGTPIVWVKDGMTHLPVIVGWLRQEGDYYALGEAQWRLSRGTDKRNVEIFVDGSIAEIQVNVLGDKEEPANIDIKLSSENGDSEFNLSSDNTVNLHAAKKLTLLSENEFDLTVTEKGETKGLIQYVLGKGIVIQDEFGNVIKTSDGLIELLSKQINHNEGKEPMVLGDTLAKLLSDLIDAIMKLTVMSPVGVTSVPVNIADFSAIKARIDEIKSKISNLE